MIVARGTEHVGSWHFWLDRESPETPVSIRWPAAIAALEDICRVLTRADLILYPLQAKVFFGVTPSYPPTRAATVLAEAELPPAILDLARTGEDHDADLGILAPSLVFGPTESRVLPDVFGVDCVVTSHSTTITAWTRSDVWMPYNLMAQSQSMVAALNAPRLRTALEAIERIVGSPGSAEDSPFAKVDGYELRNHIVRGDVLDIQDMGYDESWIAERWPEPDPWFDEPAP